MKYSKEIIEEVTVRNDIIEVIGQFVDLKKKGSNYFGLCPFHNEKAASFSVSPSKQMYYCFGCNTGGDVISFCMEYGKMSFTEALRMLAERAGVSLPEENGSPKAKKIRYKRNKLMEIIEEATKYYEYQLLTPGGEKGLAYLKDRNVSDEIMARFRLGFSNNLTRYLRTKGYSDALMIEAGIASHDEQHGTYDKFWNRVMFPIQDVNSKVVGFGGRAIGNGKPKYLNSPGTIVFDKGQNLFGLNYAKTTREGYIILCEGYMDVITMHQAGFDMAVASLGTAFTVQQAQLLKKYTDTVIIAYDSDDAGITATLRCIKMLKEVGVKCKVLDVHPYKDPDELIKNTGVGELQTRIQRAQNPFFFEIGIKEKEFDMSDPAEKTEFYRFVANKLCDFTEPLERGNYLEAVAKKYSIDEMGLRELVTHLDDEARCLVP